jgi:REP element-mobilizing transposase RayT
MARALRIQYPGAFYHVTCRGNERRAIFWCRGDRKVFLEKLALSSGIYNISILAYVLMTNHFHLLLTTPDGNLSEFMRHFNISYTAVFNRRHNRVGHLYQGRYKAFLVEADSYLLEVSRYIHLNPIKTGALKGKELQEKRDALAKYEASSLGGYLWREKRSDFVNYNFVLDFMGGDTPKGRKAYGEFVDRGVAEDLDSPLDLGKGAGIIGTEEFVEWVKTEFVDKKGRERERPALRQLKKLFSPEQLVEHYIGLVGEDRKDVLARGRNTISRAMLMEFLYRFCHITQSEIGQIAGGIDYSAVSQARSRLRKNLSQNKELKQKFEAIERQLLELSRIKI